MGFINALKIKPDPVFLRRSGCLAVVLTISLLTGCETFQTRDITTNENGSPLDNWQAKGKFSYRSEQLSQSGNFDWQQNNKKYEIRLYGPFGLGSVRLSGDLHSVQLRKGNETYSSNKPQSLLHDATGLEIPINELANWMLGRPNNRTIKNISYADNGAIQSFSENGWKVSYPDYKTIEISDAVTLETTQLMHLPTGMLIEKDQIEIQLITKSWDF